MKTHTELLCCTLVLFTIALAGCTANPSVTELWIDDAYVGQQYGKILVIGAARKITFRNLFEEEFVNQLKSKGIDAIPSYHILPYNDMLTREIVLSAVEKSDIDSILITSLVERSKKTVYYSLDGGDPYAYYTGLHSTVRSPETAKRSGKTGSYEVDVLFLKTNLYDANTEKLIWSMTSESEFMYKTKSLNSAISLVINKLRKDGLI
jgi:hypothetical protein